MIHPETFKKQIEFFGAKGLVFIGEKIIAYRRDNNTNSFPLHIDLPGGRSEVGESPFDTFQREVKEEFNINLNKEDIIFTCRHTSMIDPKQKSFFFVTKPLNIDERDIVFGDEGIEWMLLKPEDFIVRPDGIQKQQDRIRKYLNGSLIED